MMARLRSLLPYRKAPLLTLISIFLMMQSLSTDMYVASLPSLASYFDVPASAVQMTLSIFVIGFGIAQLAVGPFSDRFGRRPVLLCGLALYLSASILCALAPAIWLLIAARPAASIGLQCDFYYRSRHHPRRVCSRRRHARHGQSKFVAIADAATRPDCRLIFRSMVRLACNLCLPTHWSQPAC